MKYYSKYEDIKKCFNKNVINYNQDAIEQLQKISLLLYMLDFLNISVISCIIKDLLQIVLVNRYLKGEK